MSDPAPDSRRQIRFHPPEILDSPEGAKPADGEVIHGHHQPPALQTAEATGTVVSGSLGGAVATFERTLIEEALKTTRGNRAKAARLLNSTERVINYKMKKYGIDPARLRA